MSSTSDAGKTNKEKLPKAKSIRRFSIGSMMAIQLIGAFLLLIGINVIAYEYGRQIDLTRQSSYTLSELTLQNLQSSIIKDRIKPVRIIAVVDPSEFALIQKDSHENVSERILGKLQEYADASNGKIELQFVNPIIDHASAQLLTEKYNIRLKESVLIIDAYNDTVLSEEYIAKLKELYPKQEEEALHKAATDALIARHVRLLPVKELFYEERNINYNNQAYISKWKDESELTTNLMRAVEGKSKKVYFLFDKCRLDSKLGGMAPWEFIRETYRSQNIQLVKLNLSETPIIPQDADGIAIISPMVDFTERELKTLREYWEARVGSSVFITLDPEVHLPQFYSYLLKSSDLKPMKNRIISNIKGELLVNSEVLILQGPQVNGDLVAKSTTFDGASQSIEIIKSHLASSNVEAFPLIQTAQGWWGETQFDKAENTFDERYDHSGPLNFAAAVTRGKLNDQTMSPFVSKMVMIGNSDFLSKRNIREEQKQYLAQVGNWLVGREPLMNIKQEPNYLRKVFIARGYQGLLSKIFIFFIPVTALLITAFIWNTRRS